jgi:hypothetical protein
LERDLLTKQDERGVLEGGKGGASGGMEGKDGS